MKRLLFLVPVVALLLTISCKKSFLEVPIPNGITFDALGNRAGVAKLLTGAYHDLTGLTQKSSWWSTSGTNWIYGDITSGDAFRGGGNDGSEGIIVEHFQTTSNTGFLADKWRTVYDGIFKSNAVIVAADTAIDMSDQEKVLAKAEARFLRGHFHFDAKKMWNKVPFVDKIGTELKYGNSTDIWPLIEEDFQYAYDNLPEIQTLKGKANKWAAACYLAKAYMFQNKLAAARELLNTIIPATC
ncbi:MAG TPA: RagB/SusD family nutrient uptake outer membrane protein, partial [Flavitalea sp.]|nr:RagB/SusD family nutrient uptake outer membrane protein [Flavitalea sp.]